MNVETSNIQIISTSQVTSDTDSAVREIGRPKKITIEELDQSHFAALKAREIQALVVDGFLEAANCVRFSEHLLKEKIGGYSNLRDNLHKIGPTVFELAARSQRDVFALQHYRREVFYAKRDLAALAQRTEQPWPFDQMRSVFRQHLNAEPLIIDQLAAFAGLVRVIKNQMEILPHQDELAEDLGDAHDFAKQLKVGGVQLAANLYLSVPDAGGEIEIWNRHLAKDELGSYRQLDSDYGLDRNRLGAPDLVIKPEAGQLILLDSTLVHAVSQSRGDIPRVSISCFVGVAPSGEARYWS